MSKTFFIKPIILTLGIVAASLLIMWVEAVRPSDFGFYKDIFQKEIVIQREASYPLRATGRELNEEEMKMAKVAWRYFLNNYQTETGLVNSVDMYHSTTFWDITSSLFAFVCAYEIGIIDSLEFDFRLTQALGSLGSIVLYKDIMPNKVYHTETLGMVDYNNRITTEGVGWSAMDIGRFFAFVNMIKLHYPQYWPLMRGVISRWEIEGNLLIEGTLHGIGFSTKDRTERTVQEGKLGYEEYTSKGLMMVGFDASESLKYTDFIRFKNIFGIDIAVDTREVKYAPAYNYVLSEPYILDGIEFGFDMNSRELAWRVYRAQRERFHRKGIVTAVSEDHIEGEPYFVYNAVYADGKAWNCIAENGDDADAFRTVSTKAAFGWYTLFDDPYAVTLLNIIRNNYDEERGWYSGIYESDGTINKALTANTNGIILECLNYKRKGPLVRM